MRLPLLCSVSLALWCCKGAPAQPVVDRECERAQPNHACVTLEYSVDPQMQASTRSKLKGALHWGLYHAGDVGLLGPTADSVAGGHVDDVDMSQPGATVPVEIDDVPPGSYHALGFLDEDGNGKSNAGDEVTLPSDPFGVPPNKHVTLSVPFDFTRF